MIDAGTLSALSGGFTNWDAVRSMRERALQFRQQSNNIEQQNLQHSQLADAKLNEYLQTINKAGLLAPDKKKVQDKELQLRQQISDGIKKFNGDVSSYLESGGLTELHDYQQGLLNSEEMGRGLSNYYNHNRALADAQAGLILRPIGDKTYDQHYNDYLKGKSDTIDYKGAFKRPNYNPAEYFSKIYGNKEKRPQEASLTDNFSGAFHTAKADGLNDEDARHFATLETKEYTQHLGNKGAAYQYKSEDPLKQELMRSQIYKNYKHGAGEGGGGGLGDFYNKVLTHDVAPNHVAVNKDNGYRTAEYELPAKWGEGYTNVAGVEYEKPSKENNYQTGIVANHDDLVGRNNLKIAGTNTTIDVSKLPKGSYTLEPLNKLKVQYDKDGNIVNHGTAFRLHLTPEAMEQAKVNGHALASSWGGKQEDTPGLEYKSGPFYRFGDSGASGSIDVVADYGLDNQGKPHPQVRTALEQQTQTMAKTPFERNAQNINYSESGDDGSQYFSLQNTD